MRYTALYRKWRSQSFSEVKGQEPITESLKNQIRTGRIGHAYLFCGTRGTGKTSVAKILARAVNCEHPLDGNPCNECESCKGILRDASMNVIEMDAASNNGVEDIRQIREQVEYPPVNGKYKVYIIDEVHMLSTSAFNAFLKTLEEPPEYVIFILATTEPSKLPVTILSRCQRYDFRRIGSEVIAARLREISTAERIDISEEALHYIARAGDGSMRDAVSLLDQCSAFRFDRRIEYEDALQILGAVDTGVFSELIRALSEKNVDRMLGLLSESVEKGRELTQFVSDFLFYVRNLLMAKSVERLDGLVDMSRENLQRLTEDKELFSLEELVRDIRQLSELWNQLRYSSQKRVLIETVLIKLAYPETDRSSEGTIARIAELERRLKGIADGSVALRTTKTGEGAGLPAGAVAASADISREEQRVSLPKGQYEDLMLLKKEWKRIAAELPTGLLRSTVSESWVYPNKEKTGMMIATKSKAGYNTISDSENLQLIRQIVSEKYGKNIEFRAVQSVSDETRNTIYVLEEDLKRIHFDVETVDDSLPSEEDEII